MWWACAVGAQSRSKRAEFKPDSDLGEGGPSMENHFPDIYHTEYPYQQRTVIICLYVYQAVTEHFQLAMRVAE